MKSKVSEKLQETNSGTKTNSAVSTYLRSITYVTIISLQARLLIRDGKKPTISQVIDQGLSLLEDKLSQH